MEHIRSLTVEGLRGFRHPQRIELAIPNGNPGSGLTVIVGANNSGKSTVIEALTGLAATQPTTYALGKRNSYSQSIVRITAEFADGRVNILETVQAGGAQTSFTRRDLPPNETDIGVVQSRRGFNPYFNQYSPTDRASYNRDSPTSENRQQQLNHAFIGRIFKIAAEGHPDRENFNALLARVLGSAPPNWTIDQHDTGQYFIKFVLDTADHYHSSEGVGEGIVSLFSVLTALYDLDPKSVVAIDEPELSLHPQYQRRLREIISEKSADAQIIYTTHSPYFVNWSDVASGAEIVRAFKRPEAGTCLRQAARDAVKSLVSLLKNDNAPHVLDLHASEIFFVEDGVIITEGQEDVIFFPKIGTEIGMNLGGSFYGWGAGGSGNISKICALLASLGYRKVVAVFDGDKATDADKCKAEFPNYHVAVLPADDIRSKPERSIPAKPGLWVGSGIDEDMRPAAIAMYEAINAFLDKP